MVTKQTKSKLDFLAWFNIFIKHFPPKKKKKSTESCLKIKSRCKGGVKKKNPNRQRQTESDNDTVANKNVKKIGVEWTEWRGEWGDDGKP